VAGSAIFHTPDYKATIDAMRAELAKVTVSWADFRASIFRGSILNSSLRNQAVGRFELILIDLDVGYLKQVFLTFCDRNLGLQNNIASID
jgi:hypothetical protein